MGEDLLGPATEGEMIAAGLLVLATFALLVAALGNPVASALGIELFGASVSIALAVFIVDRYQTQQRHFQHEPARRSALIRAATDIAQLSQDLTKVVGGDTDNVVPWPYGVQAGDRIGPPSHYMLEQIGVYGLHMRREVRRPVAERGTWEGPVAFELREELTRDGRVEHLRARVSPFLTVTTRSNALDALLAIERLCDCATA